MKEHKVSSKLQSQLDTFHAEPYKVGDSVLIDKSNTKPYNSMGWAFGGSSKDEHEIVVYKIVAIENSNATIETKEYGKKATINVPMSIFIQKYDNHVGINPLKKEMPDVNFYSVDIWQLLGRAGYEMDGSLRTDKDWEIEGQKIPSLNWNPFIFDKNGVKQYYQRDFIYTLKDKQLLIESIYNEISIGTFVFRKRGWNEIERLIKDGHLDVGWNEIVDGKQRLNALVEFVGDKFPDFNGNYFSDFSESAKRNFGAYRRLSYGELGENTPDKDVIKIFLNINFAGKPMSSEHLDFVKSINV